MPFHINFALFVYVYKISCGNYDRNYVNHIYEFEENRCFYYASFQSMNTICFPIYYIFYISFMWFKICKSYTGFFRFEFFILCGCKLYLIFNFNMYILTCIKHVLNVIHVQHVLHKDTWVMSAR